MGSTNTGTIFDKRLHTKIILIFNILAVKAPPVCSRAGLGVVRQHTLGTRRAP